MSDIDYLCGKLRRFYLHLDAGGQLSSGDIARCVESAERLQVEIERMRAEIVEVKAERDRFLTVAGRLSGWLPMPDIDP